MSYAPVPSLDLEQQDHELHHQLLSHFESPMALETITEPVRVCNGGHIMNRSEANARAEQKQNCWCSEPLLPQFQPIALSSWPSGPRKVAIQRMTDVVLVDVSSSMWWSDNFLGLFGPSRMDIAKDFIRSMVRLRLADQKFTPADSARHRVMLCPFGRNPCLNEPRTTAAELEVPISSLKAEDSETMLFDALRETVKYIKNNIRHGDRYRLVVLTDGKDTGSDETHKKEFEDWFLENVSMLQLATTVYSLNSSASQFVKRLVYRLPSSLGSFRSLVCDPERMAKEYVNVMYPNYEKLQETNRFYVAQSVGAPDINERPFQISNVILPSVPTTTPRDRSEASKLAKTATNVPRQVELNLYA